MRLLLYVISGIIAVPILIITALFVLFWPFWLFDSFWLAAAWATILLGSFCGYAVYLEMEENK